MENYSRGRLRSVQQGDRCWAADAVLWANQNHIINGRKSGNTNLLCPKDSATRAECATMLKQYFEKTK